MPSLFDSVMPIHEKFIANFAPKASVLMFQIGDVAPDFELPDSEGKLRRLSEFRGKPVLLVFTRIFTDKIFFFVLCAIRTCLLYATTIRSFKN